MDDNTSPPEGELPVVLELGTIGVPVNDILELEPDSEILVPCSGPIPGIVRIGGSPILRVELEVEQGLLRLSGRSLLSGFAEGTDPALSDSAETFSDSRRTQSERYSQTIEQEER